MALCVKGGGSVVHHGHEEEARASLLRLTPLSLGDWLVM